MTENYDEDAAQSLGDIPYAANKREQSCHIFEVTKTVKYRFSFPAWMELAMRGEKINAIKALRVATGTDSQGKMLGLYHAKSIVESITDEITEIY